MLRTLRLVLIVALVVWFFSPPDLRDEVPLWLPFLAVVALEAQFVLSSWRNAAPLVRRDDPRPGLEDRHRYGDGRAPEWAIAEDDEGAKPLGRPLRGRGRRRGRGRAAASSSAQRRVGRALVEPLVLIAVGALFLLLERPGWNDLGRDAQRAPRRECRSRPRAWPGSRFGSRATPRAGTSARCATPTASPRVGGDLAYLTPQLCYALDRLALHGDVTSFSQTARAIAVLAHEAWHLRGVANERRTECFAIRAACASADGSASTRRPPGG